MAFDFKSFQRIVGDIVARQSAISALSDINAGSVILTLNESFAQEIYQSYIQMITLIQSYNLDTISGGDLDKKALEYGIIRLPATKSQDYVTILDSNPLNTKVWSYVYSGTNGAPAGQTSIDINVNTGFPTSTPGTIIIGRGTASEETVGYSSITTHPNYYHIVLSSGLLYGHQTTETVILSKGGLRPINAGVSAYVPMTNISPQILFTVVNPTALLDGEDTITNVLVQCTTAGSIGNVPVNSITLFTSNPFASAIITNPNAFTNGRDIESDADLRDRIRNYIQSLSKGTTTAIKTTIAGLTNITQTKRVVSSNFMEAIDNVNPSFLYIDDGTGFKPTFSGIGTEYVMRRAAGTEKFIQLDNFPLLKAPLITTIEQPYLMVNNSELIVEIGNITETILFSTTDFINISNASAGEVATAINTKASTIEARLTSDGKKVIIQPVAQENEGIKIIVPATGVVNANDILGFPIVELFTLNLYKNDILLTKDGMTAFVDNNNSPTYYLFDNDTLELYVDDKKTNKITVTFHPVSFIDITTATTQEVASAINLDLPGAYAVSIDDNSKVRIYSRNSLSIGSGIEIIGGTANGNVSATGGFSSPPAANATLLQTTSGATATVTGWDTVFKLSLIDVTGNFDTLHQVTGTYVPTPVAPPYTFTFTPTSYYPGLGFPSGLIIGKDKDYMLNRYNGKIELTAPLVADDVVTAGTIHAEAFLETISHGPYSITATENLKVRVDGGAIQTHTFAVTALYTAEQAADLINASSLIGVHAYTITKGSDIYLRIATNTMSFGGSTAGSIEVYYTSTATALDFPTSSTGIVALNQSPTIAYLLPTNSEDYTLSPNQNLAIIIDNDVVNKLFDLTMSRSGVISSVTSASIFSSTDVSSGYSSEDNFFNGFAIRFRNDTATSTLAGEQRIVTAYVGSLGQFTVSDDFPGTIPPIISVGDVFDLIPITAKNVVDFLNNSKISPFLLYCNTRRIGTNGDIFQISTLTEGEIGALQVASGSANEISIPFSSDGIATPGIPAGQLTLDSINGLSFGPAAIIGANKYYGGTKIKIDNTLNSYSYDFLTNGDASGKFSVANSVHKIRIGEGVVVKNDARNLQITDVHDFLTNGTAGGTFTVTSTVGLNVGDRAIIISTTEAPYTDGYIYDITGTTVTIYANGGSAHDISLFHSGDTAKIYSAPNFDATNCESFLTDGTIGGTFTVTSTAGMNIGDNVFIISRNAAPYSNGYIKNIVGGTITIWDRTTPGAHDLTAFDAAQDAIMFFTPYSYLNGIVHDVDGTNHIDFYAQGTSSGEITIATGITNFKVGDDIVVRNSSIASYTNGYVQKIQGTAGGIITVYDYDTLAPVDLSSYPTGASSKIYYTPFDVTIYDKTTSAAKDLLAYGTHCSSKISSIYDKGFIKDIVGVSAPYTLEIYDEDSNNDVFTLAMYTLGYGAELKDRNNFNFSNVRANGVDGYKNYTDLLQEVQWKIDGLENDPTNYPGVKSSGVKIEVAAPIVFPVVLILEVSTIGNTNTTVASLSAQIKTAVIKYINNLKVGDDVVLAEVVDSVLLSSNFIYDCRVTYPQSNIVIADNEIARIDAGNISLSG